MHSADLIDLPDDEFKAVVSESLRASNHDYSGVLTREDLEALRSPEVVDRTHLALVAFKKSVEGQLASKKAEYQLNRSRFRNDPVRLRQIEDDYHAWRSGSLRFKSGVEEMLSSVRTKRQPHTTEDYYLAYESLKQAIQNHKRAIKGALERDEEPDGADEVLWSMVEDLP